MATPEPQPQDLRDELDEAVVTPLFTALRPSQEDAALPRVVLQHRRRRAHERVLDALASRGSAKVPAELRREVRELVRQWAAAAFHDGFAAVEAFEIRCAQEHDRVVAEESGDRERLLAVLEREYRQRVQEQHGRIELRGIQTTHRILEQLDEVYVPLHLEEDKTRDGEIPIAPRPPRTAVTEVLRRQRQVLVVGAPGSGKSTLVSWLATRAAGGWLGRDLEQEDLLPLVVTVRSLKRADLAPRSLAEHTGCDPEVVRRVLQRKSVMLLVDGLDEAPQTLREYLLDSLDRFGRRHPDVRVLVTSRPAGEPGEIKRRLEGFSPFRLTDLTRDEVNTFIDKWCLAAEVSLVRDPAAASREAEKAAADLKRRLAESHAVQRIASNPLLVTILCVVHRFLGRKIPEHRVTLYEKCTDALLYEWDRAKFEDGAAIGQLDAVAKRRLLMGVARRVHEEHAAEIAEREVVEHFAETLPDLGRPAAEAKAIVEEIRDRSGLLVERRPGFFAFSHLTFQEYFCALDYVRTKSFGELVDHCSEPWWHEVIVLAAGAPGGGGGAISRRLLAHRNLEATFLAAQCLETETDMPSPLRREIEAAIQEMIPPRDPHTMTRLGKLGILAAPNLAMSLPLQTDPRDRQRVLFALEDIDYDPAIPAIVRCASDSDKLVALQATFILARKAGSSYVAMAALREVAPTLPENVVRHVRDHFVRNELSTPEVLAVLDDALKTKRSAAPSPAPAKGTA